MALRYRWHARLGCALFLLVVHAAAAVADPLRLDLAAALARARERAPDAIVALAQIEAARVGRVGAAVRFTQSPELQLGAGMRFGEARTVAIQGQLTQPLELTRRTARLGVADAEVVHAEAVSAAALRALSFAVAQAFYEARFHDLALALVTTSTDVARRALEAAVRRRRAGDLTDLDVNLATIALGRARSATAAARAARIDAVGRLAALVGATEADAITLGGELRLPTLATTAAPALDQRADLQALAAELGVARAEQRLARANGRPDLGLWVGYQRDEADPIVLGGVSVTLPVWNRMQGEQAVARARQRRVSGEHTARLVQARRAVTDEAAALEQAREAVAVFEREVLPALADSEALLDRSIETGQIAVSDFLVARQEILGARREHLERQLQEVQAALAALAVAGGVL